MGKSTISMARFNSYVSSPEGKPCSLGDPPLMEPLQPFLLPDRNGRNLGTGGSGGAAVGAYGCAARPCQRLAVSLTLRMMAGDSMTGGDNKDG